MFRPKIFIASASQSLDTATAVNSHLSRDTDSETWTTSFDSGDYIIPSLLEKARGYDFAVMIFDPVDTTSRPGATSKPAVRDNVLLEAGIFLAALGLERVFLLVPSEADISNLASDLNGLVVERYSKSHRQQTAAVEAACRRVLERVRKWQNSPARSSAAYRRYLGLSEARPTNELLTIAHCARVKWSDGAMLTAPGDTLGRNILESVASGRGMAHLPRIQLEDPPDSPRIADWSRSEIREATAIFLIDSPYFNEYSRTILDTYRRHMIGGSISYGTVPCNMIIVGKQKYKSDKHPDYRGHLFGPFEDYLLVMRLPGSVVFPSEMRRRNVWLVYGLTTKGSHAGAHLFSQSNFRQFAEQIEQQHGFPLPEHFEVVFRIPHSPDRVEAFSDMKEIVHFARLQSGRDYYAGDPLPSTPWQYLDNPGKLGAAPLCSVHLDLYAGCNYKCKGCIELDARRKNAYLTTEKVVKVLLDIRRLGCRDIRFYGGEPTLHPQFATIVDLADSMGFQMMLVTNGSNLGDPRIADALAAANGMRVRVSLDAHTAKNHAEHHCCDRNQFGIIKESIIGLLNRKVRVSISYLLTKDSSACLEEACRYWHSAGVESFLPRIPMGLAGKWNADLAFRSGALRDALVRVESEYGSWLILDKWVRSWIETGFPADPTDSGPLQRSERCHSSIFRLAVSPWMPDDSEVVRPTDEAWISLCTYRRYDPSFGCRYSGDLSTWWADGRLAALDAIRPKDHCAGTYCSRAEMHIKMDAARSSTALATIDLA